MKRTLMCGLVILLASFSQAVFAHKDHTDPSPESTKTTFGQHLGTVQLPFTCSDTVRPQLEQGLALLHHMTYIGARAVFAEAVKAEPECAMGYWGQAMSFVHPLWSDPPTEDDFEKGLILTAEAQKRVKNEQEAAYVDAIAAYYAQGRQLKETHNLVAFEKSWMKVHNLFPNDHEAAAFYALAHMSTADPGDKNYTKQKKSAEIAKAILEHIPDHPGGHHYTIHAYDYAPLAEKALSVARSYSKIAPEVPHALHMPAHIFTRLGLWEESIKLNRRSADAALKHPANGKISLHYLHALDYMTYAYLQRGDDVKAQEILQEMQNTSGPYQTHVASAYTFAAVPARIALETRQWANAATLKVKTPTDYPWQLNPAMEAITHFSKAIGAARSGNNAVARQSIKHLTALQEKTKKTSVYWSKQIEIQIVAAQAWLTYQQGMKQEALELMRKAATMEAETEKHPVTPGEILPAHELLADMLFDMNLYPEAAKNYIATLERSPNRFNSLYGAARAAELSGQKDEATRYYKQLLDISAPDSRRNQLNEAKRFLGQHTASPQLDQ